MRVAILGASGQLGRKTLDAVLTQGTSPQDVVALVRKPEKLSAYAERGVEIRSADYDDASSLEAAFAGIQRVLLVPSTAAPGPRALQYDRAIAAARQANVKHLIHYSLVPTRLEAQFIVTPFLVYAESALRTSGLGWTLLRNSLYADPIAEWMPKIVKMGTIPYPTGDGRCAYVSRNDIGRAGAAVLTAEGHDRQVYHLTGPKAVTTAELCNLVERVTGQPVSTQPTTDEDYVRVCREEGESEFITHALLSLYHTVSDGHLDVTTDDIATLTGQPAEDLESFLKHHWKIHQSL